MSETVERCQREVTSWKDDDTGLLKTVIVTLSRKISEAKLLGIRTHADSLCYTCPKENMWWIEFQQWIVFSVMCNLPPLSLSIFFFFFPFLSPVHFLLLFPFLPFPLSSITKTPPSIESSSSRPCRTWLKEETTWLPVSWSIIQTTKNNEKKPQRLTKSNKWQTAKAK